MTAVAWPRSVAVTAPLTDPGPIEFRALIEPGVQGADRARIGREAGAPGEVGRSEKL